MSHDTRMKHDDLAALVLRVGLGILFVFHGAPKLLGGPAVWSRVGTAMAGLGITFTPTLWGLMAALSEFGGGLLLLFGLFTRPACVFMTITMLVALSKLLLAHADYSDWSHPVANAIAFVALCALGPGLYSVDAKLVENRPLAR